MDSKGQSMGSKGLMDSQGRLMGLKGLMETKGWKGRPMGLKRLVM